MCALDTAMVSAMSYGPEFHDPELYRMMARQPTLQQSLDAALGISSPPPRVVIDARAYPDGEPLASRCRRRTRAALRFVRTLSVSVCAATLTAVISGVILTWLAIR
jgi:hypothetical protein